jgi:predicted ATPase
LRAHPRHAHLRTRRQLPHQPVQRPQPGTVEHRPQAWLDDTQHIGGITADRSRRTVGQIDHQQQHAVPPLERLRRQQPTEQRVRLGHHPHLTRQDRTQLLQSVAFTVGVGKTHMAQALGHAVARRGGDVRFAKTSRVLSDLAGGHADRTWGQRIRECTKPLVLILDDFAMREHTAMHADDLYELISDRAVNGRPLILTSNRSPKDWYNLFPNPVVAESLLDRLINTSHQILMDGPSYRPRKRPGAAAPVDNTKPTR